jgi:hypothetical protein
MRVRLTSTGNDTLLPAGSSADGCVLHPESKGSEWAIVALDCPLSPGGATVAMVWLRPTVAGGRVGDATAIAVHIAAVTGVTEIEGHPVYKVGKPLGTVTCIRWPVQEQGQE